MFQSVRGRSASPTVLFWLALAGVFANAQSTGHANPRRRPGDNLGLPLVQTFSPDDYRSGKQVFDAAQSPDGVMAFVCPEDFALLRFDGERWTQVLLDVAPLSLAIDRTARTWIGSSGNFGYLEDTPAGERFVSLAGDTLEDQTTSLSFSVTRCTPNGVFFLSQEMLVFYDGESIEKWDAPPGGGFSDIEFIENDVFVLEARGGLLELVGGKLEESFALGDRRASLDALHTDGMFLTGVWLESNGLGWVTSEDGVPHSLEIPEATDGMTFITDVATTPCGELVISTARGIVIVGQDGEFRRWLDHGLGLPSSMTYTLFTDRDGAVWGTQSNGIVRFDASIAVSHYGPALGLEGALLSMTRHEGDLYCGTYEGLFRLNEDAGRSSFQRLESLSKQPIYGLLSTRHGLLLATELGVLVMHEGRVTALTTEQCLAIASLDGPDSDLDSDVDVEESFVVAGFESLQVFHWVEEIGWQGEPISPLKWGAGQLLFDGEALWIHTFDRGLVRVPYDSTLFGKEAFGEECVMPGRWLGIDTLWGTPAAWNGDQVVALSPDSCSPAPLPSDVLTDWPGVRRGERWVLPMTNHAGDTWLLDAKSFRRLDPNGDPDNDLGATFQWISPFSLAGAYFDDADPGIVWLAAQEGLLRVQLDEVRPHAEVAPLFSLQAIANHDEWTSFESGSELPALATLRIQVADTVFEAHAADYRFRLDGFEERWSEWAPTSMKEYTQLPGGSYVLHVQSGHMGRLFGESQLAFEVRPAWYAAWPARLAGIGLIGLIIVIGTRLRSAHLERENHRLGDMVDERTRDLRGLNSRLIEEKAARESSDQAQRKMQSHLHEAERLESLGTVAGGIAHDFNNYLTAIQGYTELALDTPGLPTSPASDLAAIKVISRQAAELCSGLQSLSGRTPLARRPLDVAKMIFDVEPLLRSSARNGSELRLELARVPSIYGDASQLQRVLVNLVVNAAEALEQAKHGTIVIRTGVTDLTADELGLMRGEGDRVAGPYVFIEVEDNGDGMSPDTVHRLFDPFFSTKFVGRGLGLPTVFRIVSSHEGAIDLRTEPGRGTTFRIVLPRHDVIPHSAKRPAAATAAYDVGFTGRALVVDDDDQVRAVGERLCERMGFDVISAADGLEALDHLERRNGDVDVVLLDISMPGIDGIEVHRRIRSAWPRTPVVLTSGYVDCLDLNNLDPVTSFLPKPFSIEQLRNAFTTTALASAREA